MSADSGPSRPAAAAAARPSTAGPRVSEAHLLLALEGTNTGYWEWDVRNDVIRWSDAVGPLHGLPRGAQPADYAEYQQTLHPDDRARLAESVRLAVTEGRGYDIEFRRQPDDGQTRWIHARGHPVVGEDGEVTHVVGISSDVTERKQREDALSFIAQAGDTLTGMRDPATTLREIARLAVPRLADWCIVQLADDEAGLSNLAVEHIDPGRVSWARALAERYPPDPSAQSGAAAVIRSGRPELYPEISDELLVASAVDAQHLEILRELQMRSAIVVPLLARGRSLGAITFIYAESGRRYDDVALALAMELGARAGLAIDHAHLFEREHRNAVTLQRALLPARVPALDGFEIAVRYLPGTEGDAAGGDFYDAFELPDGRYGLAIGDIVGRGIEAAAMMGQVRNALRSYALYERRPGEVVQRLHGMVDGYGEVPFATALYAIVDPQRGEVALSGAGHPPPLVIGAGARARYAEIAPGRPLGAGAPPSAAELSEQLSPGDALLLYTDGLVERPGTSLDERMALLAQVATDGRELELEQLADRIVAQMGEGGDQRDDVALLALRRR